MGIAIANPIYDTVFKFLMEDLDIAREFIGEIIHEEILSIQVRPQESTASVERTERKTKPEENISFFTVYRLDFLAEIRTKEGPKKVLIELQKAKLSSDIMRFRRYLGSQYQKDHYPIIAIYILGHHFDPSLPKVIEVSHILKDRLHNRPVEVKKNEFIESLNHDSFIIQLHGLPTEMQTRLERILSIFDAAALKIKEHIMVYDEPMSDELQKKIAARLNYAASDETVKRQMDLEEEVLMEMQDLERKIEEKEKTIQKITEEKDKTIEEKDRIIEELKQQLKKTI